MITLINYSGWNKFKWVDSLFKNTINHTTNHAINHCANDDHSPLGKQSKSDTEGKRKNKIESVY